MLGQHAPAEWVDLDLPYCRHPGPLETQLQAADAAEEAEDIEAHATPSMSG
jgi:hypothetical protein